MRLDQPLLDLSRVNAAPKNRCARSFFPYQGVRAFAIWLWGACATDRILQLGLLAPAFLFVFVLDRACAEEVLKLTLKDHRFSPAELTVAAGARFNIEVENLDSTPAEFESSDLRV